MINSIASIHIKLNNDNINNILLSVLNLCIYYTSFNDMYGRYIIKVFVDEADIFLLQVVGSF